MVETVANRILPEKHNNASSGEEVKVWVKVFLCIPRRHNEGIAPLILSLRY